MKDILDMIISKSTTYAIKGVCALIILLIGFKLIKSLEKFLKKEHKFGKLDASVKGFLVSFIVITLKIMLFIIVATYMGIPMTTIVTLVGSCALAIGLALQGGLTNIAGGLMILIFKPFRVGDYIKASSEEGTVKSITMFYTTLTTVDNKEILIPNGTLTSSNVVNFTANKKRRVDFEFSVSYDSNIKTVKKVINSVLDKNELLLPDEEKLVRLKTQGDSALIFVVRVWTNTENYWNVYFDVTENVKEAFDKNNIEIPFPQLDIHTKK